MDSLHPPCTPLKKKYDACFNHWFSEYLQLAAPSSTPTAQSHPSSENRELSSSDVQRQDKLRSKSEEYEKRCGNVWRAYRTCLEDGLNDKELQTLVAEAREEFPLKKPKDVGMDA